MLCVLFSNSTTCLSRLCTLPDSLGTGTTVELWWMASVMETRRSRSDIGQVPWGYGRSWAGDLRQTACGQGRGWAIDLRWMAWVQNRLAKKMWKATRRQGQRVKQGWIMGRKTTRGAKPPRRTTRELRRQARPLRRPVLKTESFWRSGWSPAAT